MQIAMKGDYYTIEFTITEDNPLVETDNIQWKYQENPDSKEVPYPQILMTTNNNSNDTIHQMIKNHWILQAFKSVMEVPTHWE